MIGTMLKGRMANRRKGIGTIIIVAVIAVIVVVAAGFAAYYLYFNPSSSGGIGTSTVSLQQSSGSVAQGASISVQYTVSLASGTKWGTNLTIVDNSNLTSHGITVTPSTGEMDPTYTGTLSIAASSTVAPGTYTINLAAKGDDPSTSNTVFVLTVTQASSVSSSSTASTTTTTTGPAQTVSTTSKCNGYYC
ncbi:MAG: hypothetical protein ACYC7D_14395 [Nitrososphaerales archaeon]